MKMKSYLARNVFSEPRTKNRTEMLRSVSEACVELIRSGDGVLEREVEENTLLNRWNSDDKKTAINLLSDDIHRIQLSIDVLASWGDQEIYDFVGIQSL